MNFTDSPIYKQGYSTVDAYQQNIPVRIRYDGKPLPSFMFTHGYDPSLWQELLRLNKISAFELEQGMEVIMPSTETSASFSLHPEA